MRPISNGRYGMIININGKKGLLVQDLEGNYATIEVNNSRDTKRGEDVQLRGGGSCYKTGFKSKFSGSYWSKWMWHSMGFAGYDYSFTIWNWNFTIEGYASYAKVTSFRRWAWILFRTYKTRLNVNISGTVYNHNCKKAKNISSSNSKSHSWICATTKKGLWRSRIKNNSLHSAASAQNVGSSNISIK